MSTLTFRTSPWSDPPGTYGPIVDSPSPARTTHFDGEGGYLGVPDADDGFDEPFDFVGEPIPPAAAEDQPGAGSRHIPRSFSPIVLDSENLLPKTFIERRAHPILTGKLSFIFQCHLLKPIITLGEVCDQFGVSITEPSANAPTANIGDGNPSTTTSNSPPPTDASGAQATSSDWTPFQDRLCFETADFIFRKNQMSAGNIDHLMKIWSATLHCHNDLPPFRNHKDLYAAVDNIAWGGVPWESFTVHPRTVEQPEGTAGLQPSWINKEYEVFFRDPQYLIQMLIKNPDFDGEFDFVPYQEYHHGEHSFSNFMSGDWAWRQAVEFLDFMQCDFAVTHPHSLE